MEDVTLEGKLQKLSDDFTWSLRNMMLFNVQYNSSPISSRHL